MKKTKLTTRQKIATIVAFVLNILLQLVWFGVCAWAMYYLIDQTRAGVMSPLWTWLFGAFDVAIWGLMEINLYNNPIK